MKLIIRILELLCCGMGLNGAIQREMTIEIQLARRAK